jgi:hypothetical protein
VVADLAAIAEGVDAVKITLTRRPTNPDASAGQPIILVVRPSVVETDVLSFEVTRFTQSLKESRYHGLIVIQR